MSQILYHIYLAKRAFIFPYRQDMEYVCRLPNKCPNRLGLKVYIVPLKSHKLTLFRFQKRLHDKLEK